MGTEFIDAVEAGDAVAFQKHFDARIADKVATALDACKVEVAKTFFNPATEASEEEESTES